MLLSRVKIFQRNIFAAAAAARERERERERERKLKLEAGAFRAQLPRRPQFESLQKVLAVMNQFLYLSKSVIVTVSHHILFRHNR